MRLNDLSVQFKPTLNEGLRPAGGSKGNGDDFAQTLMDVLKEVNDSQNNAREMKEAFMTGQNVDIGDIMIASERASLAIDLTMQVRNKLLEAYQEISRTQI